jgi:hypothetical protein
MKGREYSAIVVALSEDNYEQKTGVVRPGDVQRLANIVNKREAVAV